MMTEQKGGTAQTRLFQIQMTLWAHRGGCPENP